MRCACLDDSLCSNDLNPFPFLHLFCFMFQTSKLGRSQSLLVRHKDILVLYQQSEDQIRACDSVLVQWLSSVWFQHVPTPNLMVMDSFGSHGGMTAKAFVSARRSYLSLIPPSCSPLVQPLLWGLTWRFKVNEEHGLFKVRRVTLKVSFSLQQCIEDAYLQVLREHQTSSRIMKDNSAISDSQIIQWTNDAYQAVSKDKVRTKCNPDSPITQRPFSTCFNFYSISGSLASRVSIQ